MFQALLTHALGIYSTMSAPPPPPTKKGPGGHYSGANPVPNIQKFIQSLDSEKKERDSKIEAQAKSNGTTSHSAGGSETKDHINKDTTVPKSRKSVTDPVTGRQVEIEDVNTDFMSAVDNPTVCASPMSPLNSILKPY